MTTRKQRRAFRVRGASRPLGTTSSGAVLGVVGATVLALTVPATGASTAVTAATAAPAGPTLADADAAVHSGVSEPPARAVPRAALAVRAEVRGKQVVATGATRARRAKVVVQRQVAGKRWRVVTSVRSRAHRFRVAVRRPEVTTRYRFVVPGSTKAVRTVRIAPKPRPEPRQAASDACGLRPAKADGTLWSCTFVDEFDGAALDRTKWTPQVYGYATGDPNRFACYVDDADHIAVRDGALHLSLTHETVPQLCADGLTTTRYWAGMVSTHGRFSQAYGRFEARMRNTATDQPGLHEAFWLFPDGRNVDPMPGEIDIVETYSVYPNLAVPFLHYDANPASVISGPHQTTAYDCLASRGEFHTYRLEWTATRIEIYVDDQLCLRNTSGDPAFRQNYIVALTQALGSGTNAATDATTMPAHTTVDWVRVWE